MSSTTTSTPQVEAPTFVPVVPSPASSSGPSTRTHESEGPRPSPSVEDISGFPRINTGYVAETTAEDPDLDVAAYPYPNSKTDSKSGQTSYPNASASPDPGRGTRALSDPFAAQREDAGPTERNPCPFEARDRSENDEDEGSRPPRDNTERWLSDDSENPVSPSSPRRLRSPKGNGRDGRIGKPSDQDGRRHSTLEKGWARIMGRRSSRGEKE